MGLLSVRAIALVLKRPAAAGDTGNAEGVRTGGVLL
jgi:hypothetical protein